MFGSIGESTFGGGFGNAGGLVPPKMTNMTNKSRGSVRGGGSNELIRALGLPMVPATVRLLDHEKASFVDGKVVIEGKPVDSVRLIGWVESGSVEEMNGEFLFKFSDGTGQPIQVLISVAQSDEEDNSKAKEVNRVLEKCTLRSGLLKSRLQITGTAGVHADELVVRATHLREADPIQAAFYHEFDVAQSILLHRNSETKPQPTRNSPNVPESSSTAAVTLDRLKATGVPSAAQEFFPESDETLFRLGCAIEYIAAQHNLQERMAPMKPVLDLLACLPDAESKEQYLEAIHAKLEAIELYSTVDNPTENDPIYFLLD